MNAESHSSSSRTSNDADLATRLAELDELQRQQKASPHSGTTVGLFLVAAIGLPLVFFGFIKGGQMFMASRAAASPAAMAMNPNAPKSIDWIYEVKAGSQLAVANNKSMMISFYTDWCPACKGMDAQVYTNPAVTTAAQNIVAVKINAEGQSAIANQYAITKYPTIVWTDSVGNEKYRQVGSSAPYDFASKIMQYK